jgi:hypothetical protein
MTILTKPHLQAWRQHRAIVFAGMFDSHIETGECYQTRALADLFDMRPVCTPKQSGPAVIPSSYADHDARSHAAQRTRGSFVALTADIDTGDHPIEAIVAAIRALVGRAAALIYSSPHSRPSDRRWRVILPLTNSVSYGLWFDAQVALCDHLETHDITPDRALCRAAQPVFLPNVPRVHDKTREPLRSGDGKPLYYECVTTGIDAPGICIDEGPLALGIAAIRKKRADDDCERERIRAESEARRPRQPQSENGAIIAEFVRTNRLTTLLELYGYKRCPRHAEDWRSPHQTSQTYATRVMGNKWVSQSASDTAAGLGRNCATGCYGDAYDLFAHYEHRGNHKAAFRQLYAERESRTSRSAA